MPDNDDNLIFDFHEHHGTGHNCTHDHDQHPRHHHDEHGSVYYYPFPGVVDVHNKLDGGAAAATLIGDTGYDITHRTPRTHRPTP